MKQRVRKYHFEDAFGIDQFSMKIFRALHRKMSRDYLPFVSALSRLYSQGPMKEVIKDFDREIHEVLSIVDHALEETFISNEQGKELVQSVTDVEELKEGLEQQARTVKAFAEKLGKVEAETGISTDTLNVTRDIASQGVAQVKRETKEPALDYLNRVAPKATETMTNVLKGAATGLAGPYAPAIGMLSDVTNIPLEMHRKHRQRKEAGMSASIRPHRPGLAEGLVTPGGRHGAGLPRFQGFSDMGGPGTGNRRADNNPLMQFFNKGAFTAKWTKQLLLKISSIAASLSMGGGGGKGKGGVVSSVLSGATGAGLAATAAKAVPVLGAAAVAGGAALAGGVAITQAYKASKAEIEFKKARERLTGALQMLASQTERTIKQIQQAGGIEAYAEKAEQSPRQVAMDIASTEQWVEQQKWANRSPWKKAFGVSAFVKKPELQPFYDRVDQLERELAAQKVLKQTGSDGSTQANQELLTELKRISRNTAPAATTSNNGVVSGAAPRDAKDSGDVLLNSFIGGGLSIRE